MYNIAIITYNQGSLEYDDDIGGSIKTILQKLKFCENDGNYIDILALCLQESKTNLIIDKINKNICKKYKIIHKSYERQGLLGKLQLVIWCHKTCTFIKTKSGSYKCPGVIGGPLFTKGALYCNITVKSNNFKSNNFTVVDVHLPSSPSNVASRNKCLTHITNLLPKSTTIMAGDMNYRSSSKDHPDAKNSDVISKKTCYKKEVCENNPENETCSLVTSDDEELTPILSDTIEKVDQYLLSSEKMNYKEDKIKFCETCRFVEKKKENDNYVRTYDSKRYPSWCDRIIYSENNATITCNLYDSDVISNYSDHNCVYGLFSLSFS